MKKILAVTLILSAIVTGCLKDKTINTEGFNNTATFLEIQYSGLEYFSKAAVLTAGATAPIVNSIIVDVAGTNGSALSKDVTLTLAVDDAARTAYNASNPIQYEAMPDSCYSFAVKSNTLKAGKYLDTFYVTIYPAKVDPSKNYMLAITLKDAQGQAISGNFATAYYHTLGNPLAGNYNVTGTRYNYTGVVAWNNVLPVPAGYTATTNMALYSPRLGSPDDTQTIEIPFGNVGSGYNYVITYTASTSSISVTYSAPILAYSNIVTTVASFTPPSASVKPAFRIITHYNNAAAGAGNDRIFDETFVHQ